MEKGENENGQLNNPLATTQANDPLYEKNVESHTCFLQCLFMNAVVKVAAILPFSVQVKHAIQIKTNIGNKGPALPGISILSEVPAVFAVATEVQRNA